MEIKFILSILKIIIFCCINCIIWDMGKRSDFMRKILLILVMIILIFCTSACSIPVQESNDIKEQILIQEPTSVEPIETGDTSKDNSSNQPKETPVTSYDKILKYLQQKTQETFTPYYEVLDSEISNYEESTLEDGTVEAIFIYTVTTKNYDKDPDTVGYIKAAKEKNDPHYQTLYDEYLQPKEGNFTFKAIINNKDEITLYTDNNPHSETDWVEFDMAECIIS